MGLHSRTISFVGSKSPLLVFCNLLSPLASSADSGLAATRPPVLPRPTLYGNFVAHVDHPQPQTTTDTLLFAPLCGEKIGPLSLKGSNQQCALFQYSFQPVIIFWMQMTSHCFCPSENSIAESLYTTSHTLKGHFLVACSGGRNH